MEIQPTLKKMPNFYCEICDFTSSKESNMSKHLTTRKHRDREMEIESSSKKMPKNAILLTEHKCETCGKKFITSSGLWMLRMLRMIVRKR